MAKTYFALRTRAFFQNWTDTAQITANDDFGGVESIVGFRSADVTSATGVDPRTITTDAGFVQQVFANVNSGTSNSGGGVQEVQGIADPTIALQGSNGADFAALVVYLDATGRKDVTFSARIRDLDTGADNAVQQVVVQYRLGDTGAFINAPGGYVADATTANSATQETVVTFTLPPEANNQPKIEIRILTTNAAGNDELVGIDDISVTSAPLSDEPPVAGPGSFSINDAAVTEGDGETLVSFTVTRDADSVGAATVDYALSLGEGAGQADASDFSGATTGTLSFAEGEFSKTITLLVAGDTVSEPNEAFGVTLSNPTGGAAITDGSGAGTITNDDFTITRIFDIQGAQHRSAFAGQLVATTGIVTAVDSNGFYLQDAAGDGNFATSDAIFVFTGAAPTVSVGHNVTLSGTVTEFTPGGVASGNLSITQIQSVTSLVVNSVNNTLPAAVVLGPGGRLPPTEIIEDDNFASFDPASDGIDFYESLEGMLVHVPGGTVVAPTTSSGEIYVVTRNDAGDLHATNLSARGTANIDGATGGAVGFTNQGPGSDFNPERIQIDADPTLTPGGTPQVDVGAVLNGITGVITYAFGNYELAPITGITVASASTLTPEVTTLRGTADRLSVATYNVENLAPEDTARMATLAKQIGTALGAPDIIGLQEIQDNDGTTGGRSSTVVAADVTLQRFVDAIFAETGVRYAFIDNPFIADDKNGGEPGGNIRNAFLYRVDRVSLVEGSVTTTLNTQQLEAQRTDPSSPFFASRVPLVATFAFGGQEVTIVDNHFAAKGGSTPLYGAVQPSTNSDEEQRLAQAQNVADYVAGLGDRRNVMVLGDLNEFETEEALIPLSTTGGLTDLINNLPEEERYSFIFGGNSQQLDHVYASRNLLAGAQVDIVHINTEFTTRPTDHDPSVVTVALSAFLTGTENPDTLTGGAGNDFVDGLGGNDRILLQQGGDDTVTGGDGVDNFYFGAAFTGADKVDGGAGNDVLALQGDYSGGVTFGEVTSIASVSLFSGANREFGDTANNRYSFNLTTVEANVASGEVLKINGANLLAGENLTFNGSAETDGTFLIYGGLGRDDLTAGAGNDNFVFAQDGRFAAGDRANGGAGYDVVYLRGDYAIDFNAAGFAGSLTGIESIGLLSATSTLYAGGGDGEFDYEIDWNDAMLASGAAMVINGSRLTAGETMDFDGSRETDGMFRLFGGMADDVLRGGAGNDLLFGNTGNDTLSGGGGDDVFRFQSAGESTPAGRDGIQDFSMGDLIDLSRIDADAGAEGNQAFSFIGAEAFGNKAGQLRAVQTQGTPFWTVSGDVDGDGVADFEVVVAVTDNHPIAVSDFIL